jgi:hypothetical protein
MNGELIANYRDTLRQTYPKSGRERAALLFRLATTELAGTRLFWRRRHLSSLTPASKSGDAGPKRFCFREVEMRLCLAARQPAKQRVLAAVAVCSMQIINSTYLTRRGQQLERRTPDSPRTQLPCYKMHASSCELLLHHARARPHCASWQHPGPPWHHSICELLVCRYARRALIGWLLLHFQARVASVRCSGRVSAPLPVTTHDCSGESPQSSAHSCRKASKSNSVSAHGCCNALVVR